MESGKYKGFRPADVLRHDPSYCKAILCRPYLTGIYEPIRAETDLMAAARSKRQRLKGLRNRSIMPTCVNREAGKELATGIEITRRCHRNALAVMRAHPELSERLLYIEGLCTGTSSEERVRSDGFQHSWLMLDDEIIDVTPDYDDSVVGDYFPIWIWSWRYATSAAGRENSGTSWQWAGISYGDIQFQHCLSAEERYAACARMIGRDGSV